MANLGAVKDLLIPGLRSSAHHHGYVGDLYIANGGIIVELYKFVDRNKVNNTVVVRRVVPPEDIEDRSYIAKFNPLLLDMMEECKREETRCWPR